MILVVIVVVIIIIIIIIITIMGAGNFPHLPPMAELQRNQNRTSACKGALCCCFSPCLISSRPPRPITADTPQLFSNNIAGFFYVSFQLMCKDEGDKTNGLTSPPRDAII